MKPAWGAVAGIAVGCVLCAIIMIFAGRILGEARPLVVSGVLVASAIIGAAVAAGMRILTREIEADDGPDLAFPESEND